ncbi:MAG: DNA polymerase IV [Candidatus Cloacimonetes bacterium]|nr:DNA polymerase IV [Candidatus Cloacimonadota bacterium]
MSCRKIIHVDMDAFFAAVEMRDHPEYRGKPLIVGGKPDSRGVVSTCNYEARKYGIHSAMPSSQAYRLCPQALFVRGNFDAYREVSQQVREIFYQYTDLVEPVSIDEAYLDVTENIPGIASATEIARQIRARIREKTKLTASAGVSYCKFLAKVASDFNKPDGICVITPSQAEDFLAKLPVGKFHGIGKVSERKLRNLGIKTGADLKRWELKDLLKHFGKAGCYYYNIVRGIDDRPVRTSWTRKSIGMERTYATDVADMEEMKQSLEKIGKKLSDSMAKKGIRARTITLKIKYDNFQLNTRALSFPEPTRDAKIISHSAAKLLEKHLGTDRSVRLLGISMSHLHREEVSCDIQMIFDFFKKVPWKLDEGR